MHKHLPYKLFDAGESAGVSLRPLALPKSRASKITQFKHYTTDAPV